MRSVFGSLPYGGKLQLPEWSWAPPSGIADSCWEQTTQKLLQETYPLLCIMNLKAKAVPLQTTFPSLM